MHIGIISSNETRKTLSELLKTYSDELEKPDTEIIKVHEFEFNVPKNNYIEDITSVGKHKVLTKLNKTIK